MAVRVQTADFDAGEEIRKLAAAEGDTGAVVSFSGIVRGGSGVNAITAMTLEHYPGMTEAELTRIQTEAMSRWPLAGCTIVHRYGRLEPGENIVLVVTASAHRQAAFDAASFLMDYLKTNAPFWKKEEYAEGHDRWVEHKADDDNARERWRKTGD